MTNEQNMHKSALDLVKYQIKKHALGALGFLCFVGTRPWGIAQSNVDYDYRGIYVSREDNTYQAFVSQIYINNYAKDITLISLERFLRDIMESNIHALIFVNSPIIYASKEFLQLKRWINSHFSKKVYRSCRTKTSHAGRKDYLYDFFFIGTSIAILEEKKVIPNLAELNKKCLKIPILNMIIEGEKLGLPFEQKNENTCKKILAQLKIRLEKANKKSRLPEKMDLDKFTALKVVKKVAHKYWIQEEFIFRYQKEKDKYKT